MKQRGNATIIVVIVVIALGIIGFLIYQNTQLKKQASPASPTPTPITTSASTPTPVPTATPKPGWKLYQNQQYKFEFSYSSAYKVLTDKENLYGWPKAILLLYKGGQSYDMAVEIWNTEAEYKTKYADASSYTVFKTTDGKFITLLNANKDTEVSEIIATFKFTQ